MATSRRPIQFAQDEVKIQCDICDSFDNVNSFCRECSYNICDSCLKSHLRFHNNHTVVPVFDGILEKQYIVKCSNHQEKFKYYCKKCGENICEECITTNHAGHVFEKVKNHAKKLKQSFTDKIDVKKSQVFQVRENLDILKQRELDIKTQAKTLVDTVRSEKEKKKNILDEEEKNIVKRINQEEKNAIEKLRTQYKQLQDLDVQLKNFIESINNELSRVPDTALLKFVNDHESKMATNPANLDFDLPNLPVFTPSSFTKESDLLGSLNGIPTTKLNIAFKTTYHSSLGTQQPAPADPSIGVTTSPVVTTTPRVYPSPSLRQQLHVISKFSPPGVCVVSICAADDGMLWVGTGWLGPCLLLLINEKGEVQQRVYIPGWAQHTCVTRSGDVLVSAQDEPIYKVTRQGQVSTFVDVSPGQVWGITATQDGDVFACVDTGSGYKVQKFSSEGKFVLELDSAIFTSGNKLRYVHAVSGDTVCVQDGDPEYDKVCNLVIVTAAGQVVSRVTRTGKLKENTRAIVWDKYGNMLTGTWGGEYIHVFSGEGTCRQSYKVEGSKGVLALCLGKGGVLRIGTDRGEVITAKYLK